LRVVLVLGAGATLAHAEHFRSQRGTDRNPPLDYTFFEKVRGLQIAHLPQFLSNVAWNWQVPERARFMRRLAAFSRLIVMDPRGVGCPDWLPPGRAAMFEEQVGTVLAVLSATTSFGCHGPRRRALGVRRDGGRGHAPGAARGLSC
jgi:hypothetical protein